MSDNSEATGCGCFLLCIVLPLCAFLCAYAAHCGWSHYTP